MQEKLKCLTSFVFVNLPDLLEKMGNLDEEDVPNDLYRIAFSWRATQRVTPEETAMVQAKLEELLG